MGRQYTIHSVSDSLDSAVRHRARMEGKSINTVVVEAIGRGLGLGVEVAVHTDLDHLIGTWREDPGFDRAVAEFGRIDEDAWK